MGKLTLLLGGARSGKSSLAQELAEKRAEQVLYIATAEPLDQEMEQRIRVHQSERPAHWQTYEIPTNLAEKLTALPITAEVVILDCLTMLINNILMHHMGDIDNPDEDKIVSAGYAEVADLLAYIKTSPADWLVVSNEVGMGLVPPYPIGRVYRDLLGALNKQVANQADEVLLLVAGIPMKLTPLSTD